MSKTTKNKLEAINMKQRWLPESFSLKVRNDRSIISPEDFPRSAIHAQSQTVQKPA